MIENIENVKKEKIAFFWKNKNVTPLYNFGRAIRGPERQQTTNKNTY